VLIKALLLLLLSLLGLPLGHGGGDQHMDQPGHCRMLAKSKQPQVPGGKRTGNLVAVIPATTCNTPRSQWKFD
jgi:hypothetical protein